MRTANVRTIVIRTLVALVGAAGWSRPCAGTSVS